MVDAKRICGCGREGQCAEDSQRPLLRIPGRSRTVRENSSMSTPVLDDLSHRYHIEGRPLESVTRVIKSVWPNKPTFENAPVHILEHARHRGERVDFWVCEYAKHNGNVDVEDDADVVESVEFFDRWWNKVQPIY